MGAVTAAVIGAVGAVGSAAMANKGAKDAARAQQDAANMGIGEQRRQFDILQGNIQPYLEGGRFGLNRLMGLLENPDSIQDSAAYRWRFDQGMKGLDRSAAARGGLFSGGHTTDLVNYGQGMASQEYDNQYNRLYNLATMGQNAAVGAGSLGQQNANAISGLYGQIGQAQAGSAINQANAWGNAFQGLAGIAGQYIGGRSSSYSKQLNNKGW